MPTSFATISTSNMELSPVRVTYKGVDLGGTLGNATINMEFEKADILADQSGSTVRDRRVSGLNITVSTEITEIQNKDNWKVAFPHMQIATTGPNKLVNVVSKIGDGDLVNAGELLLHPLSKADADLSGDYKFYKAVADAKSEVVYGPADQVRLKVMWNILPDDSVQPDQFMIVGDPAVGLVDAVAAAAVAGANTGDGTVSGISVVNGVTKTETITLECVTAAVNGGRFLVSGSTSGALGDAFVGVGFSSSVIGLTINDGATDFVVGDTFTIATTGANYV